MVGVPELPAIISLVSYETVTSTNDEAKLLACKNAPEGTVVWAKEQIGGKGRMNRKWVSKPGNFYSSVVLRPSCSLETAAQLSFLPALAVGEILENIIPTPSYSFKWPNDILLNNKKISGILLEAGNWTTKKSKWVVIGCGVNLLHSPETTKFPATSIFEETMKSISLTHVLSIYYRSLLKWYINWSENGFSNIRAAWLKRVHGINKEITAKYGKYSYDGEFIGLDKNGALKLRSLTGVHRIRAGDVYFNDE